MGLIIGVVRVDSLSAQHVAFRFGVGITGLHGIERQHTNVRMGRAGCVVLRKSGIHFCVAYGVKRRRDGEADNRSISNYNVYYQRELARHAARQGNLFCIRCVADRNQRTVIIKQADLSDGEASHAVINHNFHVDHVGRACADLSMGNITAPLFISQGCLPYGGLVIGAASITRSGLFDVDFAAAQNAVCNERSTCRGDDGAIIVGHFLLLLFSRIDLHGVVIFQNAYGNGTARAFKLTYKVRPDLNGLLIFRVRRAGDAAIALQKRGHQHAHIARSYSQQHIKDLCCKAVCIGQHGIVKLNIDGVIGNGFLVPLWATDACEPVFQPRQGVRQLQIPHSLDAGLAACKGICVFWEDPQLTLPYLYACLGCGVQELICKQQGQCIPCDADFRLICVVDRLELKHLAQNRRQIIDEPPIHLRHPLRGCCQHPAQGFPLCH
nr:MAG TPA: hypothetical protein [Caudoviricetes sp.]